MFHPLPFRRLPALRRRAPPDPFFFPVVHFLVLVSVLFSARFFEAQKLVGTRFGPPKWEQNRPEIDKNWSQRATFFRPLFWHRFFFRILSDFDHSWMARTLNLISRRV